MSKNPWAFRPRDLRRGLRTIQSMGLTPCGVEFADGSFKIFIGPEPIAFSVPSEQQQPPANEWDKL